MQSARIAVAAWGGLRREALYIYRSRLQTELPKTPFDELITLLPILSKSFSRMWGLCSKR
jgi:hypothetical protein